MSIARVRPTASNAVSVKMYANGTIAREAKRAIITSHTCSDIGKAVAMRTAFFDNLKKVSYKEIGVRGSIHQQLHSAVDTPTGGGSRDPPLFILKALISKNKKSYLLSSCELGLLAIKNDDNHTKHNDGSTWKSIPQMFAFFGVFLSMLFGCC